MRNYAPTRCALGAALAIAAAFSSRDAGAFCRTVSKAPPLDWNVATQGCFTGESLGAKPLYWQQACVGYSLQRDASRQVTLDQATAAAASAFGAWNAITCADGGAVSINAVDLGPVECGEVRYNDDNANQNVIVFRDDAWPHSDPNNTLGLTTLTFESATGAIFGADMEINGTKTLTVRAASADDGAGFAMPSDDDADDSYDLATIIEHEAGHFLGLAHTAADGAIMFASYKDGARLIDDDSSGLCSAYLSDGRRSTSAGLINGGACDPTPRHGFSGQCAAPRSDPPADPSSKGGCALRGLPSSGPGNAWGIMGTAIGVAIALLRRRRLGRSRRTLVAGAAALGLSFFVSSSQASVSIAILFEELVARSSVAAVVTPIEQHSVWENGRIVTYTDARVDRVLAGNAEGVVSVRTLGGTVGPIGQLVDGEAVLDVDRPVLVFLQRAASAPTPTMALEVTARAQGEFALSNDADHAPRLLPAIQTHAVFLPQKARLDATRLAVRFLAGHTVDEAARDIAAAWPRLHP